MEVVTELQTSLIMVDLPGPVNDNLIVGRLGWFNA